MGNESFELKTESKFLIKIADEEDSIGFFVGYAMIGSESALVVRMDGGKYRYIPVAQITFMDLLESSDEGEKKPAKRAELLYG